MAHADRIPIPHYHWDIGINRAKNWGCGAIDKEKE